MMSFLLFLFGAQPCKAEDLTIGVSRERLGMGLSRERLRTGVVI